MTAYPPTIWHNDLPPAMTAANLNKMRAELVLQAAETSIPHTLQTWVDGAAPAITDDVPWNEIERVLTLVTAAIPGAPTYVPIIWSEGWVPPRNETNLNHIELQLEANRNVLDMGSTGIYWGARIDGGFYSSCFGTPNVDVPHTTPPGSDAVLAQFVQNAGKAPTCIQWSDSSAGNWPPPPFTAALEQQTRLKGAFTEYAYGAPLGTSTTGCLGIIAGNATALGYIRDRLAIPMRNNGHPILFRPFWEQNISAWPWGRSNLTAAQYKILWHNVWQVFQDNGATNVSFAWCPNNFFLNGGVQTTHALSTFPDDADEVDWICFNGYLGQNWWGDTVYRSPSALFGYCYDQLAAFDPTKPMGICEWGITAVGTPGKAGFFTAMLDPNTGWLKTYATRIKLHEYFNTNRFPQVGGNMLPFEQDSTACPVSEAASAPWAAFSSATESPYYQANIVNGVTFPDGAKVPIPN
jgi:hypothetical protein